jgi:hypothetical protein
LKLIDGIVRQRKSLRNSKQVIKNRIQASLERVNFYLKDDNYKTHFSTAADIKDDEGNSKEGAVVNPSDPDLNITVSDSFWEQNLITGDNSQVHIIIHEISHFNFKTKGGEKVSGTGDWGATPYGNGPTSSANYFIRNNPEMALKHAECFAFYICGDL